MPRPLLSFGAGVLLRCDDCGQALMAALTERGEAQLLHAVPVCEVFTGKAMRQTERWIRRLNQVPLSELETPQGKLGEDADA